MTEKRRISYPPELEAIIQLLMERGIIQYRSEFFQRAAGFYIGAQLRPGTEMALVLLDETDEPVGDIEPKLYELQAALADGEGEL